MAETERPSGRRPRLSDEERKRLWREAVMEKARQLKNLADVVILVMLALVIIAHALPFVKPVKVRLYGGGLTGGEETLRQRRGYEIMLGLLKPYEGTDEDFDETDEYWLKVVPEAPALLWGVQPRLVYAREPTSGKLLQHPSGGNMVRLRDAYPATVFAYFILLVPIGAVVVLVLYVLDWKLWMGRFLPGLSVVYGFGAVLYLMLAKVPTDGAWNAMRYGSALAWYLLLIPLFLLGSVSLLRFVVSQRWKRYVWAGQEIPEHLKPPEPPEEEPETKAKAGRRSRRAAAMPAGKAGPEAGEATEGSDGGPAESGGAEDAAGEKGE
jgi:hypothetical protein